MYEIKKAFTLVELLVVISIIALLMSILVPVMGSARERGRTIVCASNLKSYGLALHMYADSNNDRSPFAYYWLYSRATLNKTGRGSIPSGCRWHYDGDKPDGSLASYLQDKSINMCPTFRSYSVHVPPPNPAHSSTIPIHPSYSYSINFWIGFDWATYLSIGQNAMMTRQVSLKLTRIERPSECFAFSEENLWVVNKAHGDSENLSSAVLNDNSLWTAAGKGGYTDNIATYHLVGSSRKDDGKGNAVFVDGHVKAIRAKPEQEAYLDYGIPYRAQEDLRPIW